MWETLRTLLGLYAPFLPFVTEELFQEMYAAHESVPSLHVTAWPKRPRRRSPRSRRSRRCARSSGRCAPNAPALGLGQGRPLTELVVDAADAETRAQLESLQQSLEAAARARTIRFGPATVETSLEGVRIDIVPEPKPPTV